jgi:glycosyltransferase involved in cell wall biosynthesis
VLVDQVLREKLKQRGYAQAQKFSWDASAEQLIAAYEEIGGRGRIRTVKLKQTVGP